MLFHTFQCKKLILSLCVASLLCTQTITAFAQPTDTEASDTAAVDYDTDAAMRLEEPIDSNAIDGWPTGPVVGAEGAILLEANTDPVCQEHSRASLSGKYDKNFNNSCCY